MHLKPLKLINSLPPISLLFYQRRQPKVTNLDVHTLVQKHIPQLQVPMHDAAIMHILHCRDDLREEIPGFGFGKAFATFQEVHHVLADGMLAIMKGVECFWRGTPYSQRPRRMYTWSSSSNASRKGTTWGCAISLWIMISAYSW